MLCSSRLIRRMELAYYSHPLDDWNLTSLTTITCRGAAVAFSTGCAVGNGSTSSICAALTFVQMLLRGTVNIATVEDVSAPQSTKVLGPCSNDLRNMATSMSSHEWRNKQGCGEFGEAHYSD